MPARKKSVKRRELLRNAGIGTSDLTNIDTVDAALCALIACYFLSGNVKTYGDVVEGFIVVPAIIEVQVRRIKDIVD